MKATELIFENDISHTYPRWYIRQFEAILDWNIWTRVQKNGAERTKSNVKW